MGALSTAPAVALPSDELVPRPGSTWHVLDGTAVDSSGNPVADARVVAYALPADQSGDRIESTYLGETTTDANGRFSLRAAPPRTIAQLERDGTVSVELDIESTTSFLNYHLAVPAPGRDRTLSTAVSDAEALAVTDGDSAQLHVEDDGGLTFETVDKTPEQVTATLALVDGASAAAAPGVVAPMAVVTPSYGCAAGYGPVYIRQTSSYFDRSIPLQQLNTLSNSRIRYEWSNSQKSEFGIAFTSPTTNYSAGLGASAVNATNAGVSYTAANNKNGLLKVGWRFFQYKKYCDGNYSYNRGLVDTKASLWKPYQWTGGTSFAASTSRFTCNTSYRVSMAATTWVSRSSSRTFSGSFSAHGVSLSAKQTNSSAHKLTVIPDSGTSPKICGSNAVPLNAQRIQEMP